MEKHLKCKWHWVIFKCISVNRKTDETWRLKQILNSICWTAHISPEVTSSIWYSYICDPNSIWHAEMTFHEYHWGPCGLESNISRTKIANRAEKCAFFVLLIIIGWALLIWFWHSVWCVCAFILLCLNWGCALIVWDNEIHLRAVRT